METPGVFFMVEKYPACPKCVEGMLVREEVSPSDIAGYKMFPAEPGMRCDRCEQPMAREACVPAFEGVMTVVSALMNQDESPDEATPEDEAAAKAKEKVRRLTAEAGAAYRELAAARNKVIELTGRLDERPLPE
jgi:hypothetical protein